MESADVLSLSKTEIAILTAMVESPGRVLGRGSILRSAGIENVGARRCDSAIVSLRKVLGADAIVTVRRRGWMLTPDGLRDALRVLQMTAE